MTFKKGKAAGGNQAANQYQPHHLNKSAHFQQLDFKAAMDAAGLHTKEKITPDGKLRRFHVEGDSPGSKNGWYVLYDDGIPAGSFGSWKTGNHKTWCAESARDLTTAERRENLQRMESTRKAREKEEHEQRRSAREKALFIWNGALTAPDNYPYLATKGVRNHGLRLYKNMLVIPVCDSTGVLHSLQFIDGEGNKRFLSGGKIQGCYFPISTQTDTICIAEGYATAATIHEAAGHGVAVAFNAGNLEAVAKAIRRKFSEAEIVLCADNDVNTPGNPGLTKAREAAAAVGALLAVPPCAGDFNDFFVRG